MVEVRVIVDIDRPPGEVFDFLADMSNNPRWQKGMRVCHWTSEPPLGLGSTFDQEASFLGRKIVSSFEVTEFEPGHRIRIKTSGTMPIDVTRTVTPTDADGSRVEAIVTGEPSGVIRLGAATIQSLVARSVRNDYRRLKELLESGD